MSEPGSVAVAQEEDEGAQPLPSKTIGVRRAVATLLAMAVGVIGLDVLTKELATNSLEGHAPVRILGGLVWLSFTRNSGAAWSIGSDYTFIFPIFAIGVAVWILFFARKLRSLPWAIALGLVLGGALGNLVDRIFRTPGGLSGHVVDFVSLFAPYGEKFPIFNVADMALSFGVVLAIFLEYTGRMRDGSRLPRAGSKEAGATQAASKEEAQ
jgi:signal peptidase II